MSKTNTNNPEIAGEALEQIRCLESLCDNFFVKAKVHLFRSMSVTLRTLLVGSSGKNGLIVDCLADPRLYPLRFPLPADLQPGYTHIPAAMMGGFFSLPLHRKPRGAGCRLGPKATIIGNDYSLHWVFDSLVEPLLLKEWLEQGFIWEGWTLRNFIIRMANNAGGAHFQPNAITRRMTAEFASIHQHLIARIAESVWPQLAQQIATAYPQE
jgi:hypothetical protein